MRETKIGILTCALWFSLVVGNIKSAMWITVIFLYRKTSDADDYVVAMANTCRKAWAFFIVMLTLIIEIMWLYASIWISVCFSDA